MNIFCFGLEEWIKKLDTVDEISHSLILEREQARKNRNFARADEIRDILDAKGVEIKDTPSGTTWRKKL